MSQAHLRPCVAVPSLIFTIILGYHKTCPATWWGSIPFSSALFAREGAPTPPILAAEPHRTCVKASKAKAPVFFRGVTGTDLHPHPHILPSPTFAARTAAALQCHRSAIMATVTEKLKESLVGADVEPTASESTRADFEAHAVRDEETGELYMTHKQFIDAIAPEGEDYVRISFTISFSFLRAEVKRGGRRKRQQPQQRQRKP